MDLFEAARVGLGKAWAVSKVGTTATVAGAVVGTGVPISVALITNHISSAIGFKDYLRQGLLGFSGFEPLSVNAAGGTVWEGYGRRITQDMSGGTISNFAFKGPLTYTEATEAFNASGKWSLARLRNNYLPANAWGGISVAGNLYSLYSGYQEGGISGAYDAAMLNIGIEASMYRWGYGIGLAHKAGTGFLNPATKLAGHPLQLKTSTALLRGMGAGVGGYIGQQLGLATGIPMAGTVGALAGSYIGGSPLGALKANPILVGGTMAALGAAAVFYGAYTMVKTAGQMGYAHRQMMRGVNTDGDMASFMTQNALTMRERSVQAIAKSHLNARSALGQEANFMASPRNYNSRYR
jgi:hypothetical protein